MQTMLEVDPEVASKIQAQARERGVSVDAYLLELIKQKTREPKTIDRLDSPERDRFVDFFLPGLFPLRRSRAACFRVSADALPFFGAGKLTPARRALERPIAIACLAERAPCLPSRMCSISSRTNSPACVLGDLPSRLSSRARSIVFRSGIFASCIR